METNSHPQTNDLGSSGGQTSVVLEQSPCVFCRSSKQTEARFKTELSCIS
ncbi:hypothetical protein HanHA300_Chr03g0085061 [Helianthus annuus]|nr:hypothetical protein HanHA300_Chr03g0085061 [Helianthus annuus]KAJ0607422.1 hypothetical protein HanHA89_Chr03g0096581 [Helianthus annuus]KAJ0767478.1 hypothetical protein HanLR1_Chr03g0089861 [Helianthus annuus]